jgi:hypothetical protein
VGEGKVIVDGMSGICPAIETADIVESMSACEEMGMEVACEYGPIFAGAQ